MSHTMHEFDFSVDEVMYLEAMANYTKIAIDGSKKPLFTSKNILHYFEQLKNYTQFRRTHRPYIVNLTFIKSYDKNGRYLIMKDGKQIPVSRRNGGGLSGVFVQ